MIPMKNDMVATMLPESMLSIWTEEEREKLFRNKIIGNWIADDVFCYERNSSSSGLLANWARTFNKFGKNLPFSYFWKFIVRKDKKSNQARIYWKFNKIEAQ